MPSALSVPDIVLGDRYGASAPAALTIWTEHAFTDAGFTLARNAPYAGGYTTMLYGRSAAGCHALQIEINRSLYLSENTIQRRPNFDAVQARLLAALTRLVQCDVAGIGGAFRKRRNDSAQALHQIRIRLTCDLKIGSALGGFDHGDGGAGRCALPMGVMNVIAHLLPDFAIAEGDGEHAVLVEAIGHDVLGRAGIAPTRCPANRPNAVRA